MWDGNMGKYSVDCKGIGIPNCDFGVNNASSKEDLFEILKIHARMGHNMHQIPPEKVQAAKKAMQVH